MNLPYVGPPTVNDGGCAFSPDMTVPACGKPCEVHVLAESKAWGTVGLQACAEHAPYARAAASPILEHAFGPLCEAEQCWAVQLEADRG